MKVCIVLNGSINDYNKTKNKEVAKEELLKCDLSELETFDEDIKRTIKEIIGDDKKIDTSSKVKTTKDLKENQKR